MLIFVPLKQVLANLVSFNDIIGAEQRHVLSSQTLRVMMPNITCNDCNRNVLC